MTDTVSNPPSLWKKATLAAFLSLLFSGMGQLFNRQPRKGFVLALISHLLGGCLGHTRVLLHFPTMIAMFLVMLAWKLLVIADAAFSAARSKKPETPIPLPWLSYPVLAILLIAATLIPPPEVIKDESGFGAYKIPSASMCPTICLGDRLVADMHAYRAQLPLRGDIVIMKHPWSEALLAKRVIGLPGDIVAPGPGNSILVNGQPFHPPLPCAAPAWSKTDPADDLMWQPTKVPEGNYFVIGDNLDSSFDSRHPEFGPVTPDMLRGKPLFLYWSPSHSRIGCSLR